MLGVSAGSHLNVDWETTYEFDFYWIGAFFIINIFAFFFLVREIFKKV